MSPEPLPTTIEALFRSRGGTKNILLGVVGILLSIGCSEKKEDTRRQEALRNDGEPSKLPTIYHEWKSGGFDHLAAEALNPKTPINAGFQRFQDAALAEVLSKIAASKTIDRPAKAEQREDEESDQPKLQICRQAAVGAFMQQLRRQDPDSRLLLVEVVEPTKIGEPHGGQAVLDFERKFATEEPYGSEFSERVFATVFHGRFEVLRPTVCWRLINGNLNEIRGGEGHSNYLLVDFPKLRDRDNAEEPVRYIGWVKAEGIWRSRRPAIQ